MEELRRMLANIAEELTAISETDFSDEANDDKPDFYEYFADALDYEYTINSRKEYRSVKIWLTLGGPNIWLDTAASELRGAWGSSRESYPLPYEICEAVDLIFENFYNC